MKTKIELVPVEQLSDSEFEQLVRLSNEFEGQMEKMDYGRGLTAKEKKKNREWMELQRTF